MVHDVSKEESASKTFGEEGDIFLRNVRNSEATKHHAPKDGFPQLHDCENKLKKTRSIFVSSYGKLHDTGFAVSRHVSQREISRNADGVHCYWWKNLGSCLCAFCVHLVPVCTLFA